MFSLKVRGWAELSVVTVAELGIDKRQAARITAVLIAHGLIRRSAWSLVRRQARVMVGVRMDYVVTDVRRDEKRALARLAAGD